MLTLLIILITVGIAVYVISQQPNEFRVSRNALISAPPSEIFELVNNFQKWEAWSPWAKLDPNCKNTFQGPESGKDAVFRWDGNNKVGSGIMTITENQPHSLIRMRLEFLRPMKAVNTTEFTFKPSSNDQTSVTWTMSGTNSFIGKAMKLFMNCERMVGGQFEKGLTNIKGIAESATKEAA